MINQTATAFPVVYLGNDDCQYVEEGMQLRTHLASLNMAAMLVNAAPISRDLLAYCAEQSVRGADALIAALNNIEVPK